MELDEKLNFQTLLSGINDGFYTLNRDWQFTYANDRLCEIVGTPREQIIGRSIWELFPDTVGTDLYVQFHRALNEQAPLQAEYLYETWNRWYDHRLYPSTGGLTVIGTDITERKRSELLLVEQNRLLRLITSGQSKEGCLRAVCDSVSRLGSRVHACVLIADAQRLTFANIVTPDFPPSFVQGVQGASIKLAIGTCGAAVYNGQPVTCADIANDQRWAPEWRELCIAHGILACHSMPIIGADGLALGLLMLCLEEAREPTDWELQIAEFGAQYVSISIERDRTTSALRQSEAKYRTLFDSIDEGFCICEMLFDESGQPSDYRFLEANPMLETLTGLEQVVGKTMRELVPDLEADWYEIYGNVVRTGESVRFEQESVALSRWFNVNAFPIGEPQSNQFAVLFTNITARKQSETALQTTVQQLSAIYNSTSRLMGLIAPDGKLIKANRAALKLADSQLEDVIDQPFWDTVWFQYTAGAPETMRQSLARAFAGESVRFDVSLITPAGETNNYDLSLYPVCNEAGEVIFVVPEATDVTERSQAKVALHESEERFHNLADNIAQLAWIADENGSIFWYNRRWLDYTGLTLAESAGDGWRQVHHPDHIERVVEKFSRYLESGEHWEDTFPLRGKDGEYRWFFSQAVPIYSEQANEQASEQANEQAGQANEQQNGLRWFGTNTDITERLQAEQEREQLLVSEQNARLAAEAASRVKDEFLAVVSHELRTPLNPILGWSQLLQKRQMTPQKVTHALGIIERNAKAQAQLVNDLLDVSRILRGKIRLDVSSVALASVVREAMKTLRLSAAAKSIDVYAIIDRTLGSVSGDASRLQQVVWNLLSNAVKFTPHGGRIDIRLERVGSDAQLTISDTGKGIRPDALESIFERFRQEDTTITRQFGGLGLGLAIVRDLLALHGGTIDAESPGEGRGATFTIRLPLMLIPAPTTLAPVSSTAGPPTEPPELLLNLQGKRILVVDDDDSSRDYVAAALEIHGAEVTAVASASEAIAALTQVQPGQPGFDVLLSDIGMPDVNGYSLIQQVRRLPAAQGGQIPAIALTAYAGDLDYQQAMKAGFQRHIAKPAEPDVIVEVISLLLSQLKLTP